MEFYRYKCSDCGSTRFERTENGYKCMYCGNIQDVIKSENSQTEESKIISQDSWEQESQEQQNHTENPKDEKIFEIKVGKGFKTALIKFLICLFGGVIGLHKFFKGEIFWGIVYLCTGGLFGIGWIVDVIEHLIKLLDTIKGTSEEK